MSKVDSEKTQSPGCLKTSIFAITILFLFIIGLLAYENNYSDAGKIRNKISQMEDVVDNLEDEYIEKYRGGRPDIETKVITRNSDIPTTIFTKDFRLKNCVKYNTCPEGEVTKEVVIAKVWMPDKSANLDCDWDSPFIITKIVEEGSETIVPGIFLDNKWGPKSFPCSAVTSVKRLQYAIEYSKNLVDAHQVCTKKHGDFMYLVSGNNKETSLVRDWTSCVMSEVKTWVSKNEEVIGEKGEITFSAKESKVRSSCSLEHLDEDKPFRLGMPQGSFTQIKSWTDCIQFELENWISK